MEYITWPIYFAFILNHIRRNVDPKTIILIEQNRMEENILFMFRVSKIRDIDIRSWTGIDWMIHEE